MKAENKLYMQKYITKTKKAAGRTADFVWAGLFDTNLKRKVAPGEQETLQREENTLRYNIYPPKM